MKVRLKPEDLQRVGGVQPPVQFVRETAGAYRSTCGHFTITRFVQGGIYGGDRWRIQYDDGDLHHPWMLYVKPTLTLADAIVDVNRAVGASLEAGFGYLAKWAREEHQAQKLADERRDYGDKVIALAQEHGLAWFATPEGSAALAAVFGR